MFKKWGKSLNQIKNEIIAFVQKDNGVEFYGYYSDYDWVVFCQMFGRMIDLPKNFPMYCIDLKQIMDEKGLDKEWKRETCPDPKDEHNALEDAKWNYRLYKSLLKEKN
jgi:hypothetical protein